MPQGDFLGAKMFDDTRDFIGERLGSDTDCDAAPDIPLPEGPEDFGLPEVVERDDQPVASATTVNRWRFLCDHQPAAPRMLIKGIAPHRGILFIGGQSGAGKTFIETHLANSLASRSPFFGRDVRERVGFALLTKEGTDSIGNRLAADAQVRGLDLSTLPIAWRGDIPPIKTAEDVSRITSELLALGEHIEQRFGVRCGAFSYDTVAASFEMEDENSNADVAKVIAKLREFEDRTRALQIPVHHYGKSDSAGLRGGSAWYGGADVVLSVVADRDQLTGRVSGRTLNLAKARDGIEGPIAAFTLRHEPLGLDNDGDTFGTLVVEAAPSSEQRPQKKVSPAGLKFFDALMNVLADERVERREGRPVAAFEEWLAESISRGLIDGQAKRHTQRNALHKYRRELVAANKITCDGDATWSL